MYPNTLGGPPTPAVPIPGAAVAPGASPWAPAPEAAAPTAPAGDESEVEGVSAEDATDEPADTSNEPDAEAGPAEEAESTVPASNDLWIDDSDGSESGVQSSGAAADAEAAATG